MTKIKKALIIVLVLLAVFVFLNFGYFRANFEYIFFSPPPVVYKSPNPSPESELQPTTEPNLLTISSLGIQVPIIYPLEANEKSYQEALANGVAHFPSTANVGEYGNAYIFGHSSDVLWSKGKYKTIFAVLPKIQIGAEIKASDAQGLEYTYTVIESRKIAAKDTSVLSQQNYTRKLLTLQTSYPIGTALARWIVVAEIRETNFPKN